MQLAAFAGLSKAEPRGNLETYALEEAIHFRSACNFYRKYMANVGATNTWPRHCERRVVRKRIDFKLLEGRLQP